jgi:hypothetical protein
LGRGGIASIRLQEIEQEIDPARGRISSNRNGQNCGRSDPYQDANSMMIIDSQVHVWPADRPDRPLDAAGLDRTPYSYQQLLAAMDKAGVDRAILVPPSIDKDRNDYVIEAVQKHPDRFAIMGRVPLQGGSGRNLLAGWKSQPGMLGG